MSQNESQQPPGTGRVPLVPAPAGHGLKNADGTVNFGALAAEKDRVAAKYANTAAAYERNTGQSLTGKPREMGEVIKSPEELEAEKKAREEEQKKKDQ